MSKIKFGISVNLSALTSAVIEKKGQNGMVKGIFIPFEANDLVVGKKNIYINCNGQIDPETEDSYGKHGFLAQQSQKKWAEQTEEEKAKKWPFLGNFKVFSGFEDTNNTATPANGNDAFSEDEELPF